MAVKRWSGTAWEVYAGADVVPVKVTDGRPGKTTFIGATSPTGQVDGDIWIDQDTTTNAVVPTALTTKGDTFVATGNAAYTRLAAGNNGESLFADSSTSTGLRWQGNYVAGKNKIINGDFSIWQRGTSFTSAGTFTADRFYFDKGGPWTSTPTVSRETFTPGAAPVTGYESQYFYRWTCATAGSGQTYNSILYQKIEDARTFAGQTITISAWVKTDQPRNFAFQALREYGSGGSSLEVLVTGPTLTSTTGWVRYSQTFNIPSVSGKTIGPNSSIWIILTAQNLNTAQTYDVWGLQAELGSVATPFTTNTANPQAELAACQRYYYKSVDMSVVPGSATFSGLVRGGTNASGNRWIGHFSLPVTMRAAPSCIVYNPTTGAAGSMRNEDANTNVTVSGIFGQYQNTITQIDFSPVTSANNVVVGYIVASAEL